MGEVRLAASPAVTITAAARTIIQAVEEAPRIFGSGAIRGAMLLLSQVAEAELEEGGTAPEPMEPEATEAAHQARGLPKPALPVTQIVPLTVVMGGSEVLMQAGPGVLAVQLGPAQAISLTRPEAPVYAALDPLRVRGVREETPITTLEEVAAAVAVTAEGEAAETLR